MAQESSPSGSAGEPPATVHTQGHPETVAADPSATKSPPAALKQQLRSTSYRNFHRDLWHNFGGLFTRDNALPAALGFGATAIVSPKDDDIARYFLRQERFPLAGRIGGALGNTLFLAAGEGTIFLIGQIRDDAKFREISYSIGQALVMETVILYPLKVVTNRERPNLEDHHAFPSGHSTSAFAVAAVLDHYYGPKVAIPVYAAGAFVAFARMEQNKHYLTDVMAGAAFGWLIGKTVTRQADDKPRWTPTVSPQAKGIALGISINLDK
jgi:membrane-associated phospholipid phosphatase